MELGLLSVFGAGVLTLVTPCILPMLPVYLTLLLGAGVDEVRSSKSRGRLVASAGSFVAGFSLVFTLLGMVASSLGALLQTHREALLVGGGVLIVLFGLKYLGVLKIGWLDQTAQLERPQRAAGHVGAFLFGVVFALGWTPCVGPILGSVLTYTAATTSSPWVGAGYLLVYSLGVGIPLLGVSLAADRLLPLLKKLNRHIPKIERGTGVAMVVVGLLLVVPALVRPATATGEGGPGSVDNQGDTVTPPIGAKSDQPRLVEFFAEHCPVCERMKPKLAQLRDDCVGHRVEILEVNIDDPRNQALVQNHGIGAVPAIKLFDAEGNETSMLYGERELSELRSAAAGLISASCAGEGASELDTESGTPSCGVASTPSVPTTGSAPLECEGSSSDDI